MMHDAGLKRKRILVIWGNWGPYHYARFRTLREAGELAGCEVEGLELFSSSGHYDWKIDQKVDGVHHLEIGPVESRFHPLRMTRLALPKIASLRPDVVFVPAYWHWSLYIHLFARLRGARIVMMNESHGGTDQARGWKRALKRAIVRRFHAALVGGTPHRRHFSELGLSPDRIFTGYDAVDNDHFAQRSEEAREREGEVREELGLPRRYFLSLGRLVEKKNLSLLVEAYSVFRYNNPEAEQHLVFVGSGNEEEKLRALCRQLKLPVTTHGARDRLHAPVGQPGKQGQNFAHTAAPTPCATTATAEEERPGVHFYGFRQIDQNPSFYALADAFILPSHTEEWGLVVNEAMACGLPVLVSRTVGCAADLVAHGRNGFLFDPGSSRELAERMEALVRDPVQQAFFARESQNIINGFGLDTFAAGGLSAARAALPRPEDIPAAVN